MKKIFLMAILSIVLVSCSSDDNNESFSSQNIDFTLIAKGSPNIAFYDNSDVENIVFTNSSDWDNFLSEISNSVNVEITFLETNVDFDNFQVIAVVRELQPTGNEVEITNIVEYQDTILVTVIFIEGDATILSQPFHIVKIPKSDKPVVFE